MRAAASTRRRSVHRSFALPVVTRRPRAGQSGRPPKGGDAEVPKCDLEFLKRPSPAVISRSDFDGRFPPNSDCLGGRTSRINSYQYEYTPIVSTRRGAVVVF